ncbi:DUF721 domain-containing protein [Parabacteroides sp. OttesenSCG-928-G07]|nr:DUF721 domain-containing protein [Parabacteroides sp. OttesenSCG-928-G07]
MKRVNTQKIGDVLQEFFSDNPALYKRVLDIRVQRAWGEVLGEMVLQYTKNIYVKDKTLYVSLSSSVLRSELSFCKDRLVQSLNDYVGSSVIENIILR